MIFKRTTSDDIDFLTLVCELDAYLREKDGDEHTFYAQFNKVDKIKYVIVAYQDDSPVGCGAIKEFDAETMEVKRMYVLPTQRGKGVASQILQQLETWARELGCSKCVLETGTRQKEAVILYQKNGYAFIPNYGQYAGVENSLCFGKEL
jgi:GNAT superfamily N-acetyltransferase